MSVAKTIIRVLGDRVLVQRMESANKTPGGIVLPDMAKEKPTRGTVMAIGPGRISDDGTVIEVRGVRCGDVVLFSRYGGNEIEVDGKEYLLIAASDVLAVLS